MAYCAASDVIEYGNYATSDDETLIGNLIVRAQAIIDLYTDKIFESDSDSEATRYFTSEDDVDGATLYLDRDLVAVASITTGETTLSASDYVTEPRNDTPYYGITLKGNSSVSWGDPTSDSDYENNIQVLGQWAYSSTPPADIKHATIRLTRWLYKQRDTDADLDRPMLTNTGITIMPSQLPKDVLEIIMKYHPELTI
jgi:hypothetical protein